MTPEETVNKYLGMPFDKVDCWQLVQSVYKDLGFKIFDWEKTGSNHLVNTYYKEWQKTTFPKDFDIAIYLDRKRIAVHSGVVIGNKILHSAKNIGVVFVDKFRIPLQLDGYYHLKARDDNG